jgi:hypothetical protein
MVSTYRHRETYITMRGDCRISLEKHAAEAYVIADGSKLRNRVSEIKLYVDWVAHAKSTVPALLSHKMFSGAFSMLPLSVTSSKCT